MDQRASSDILPLRSSSEGTGKNYPQAVPVDDQSVEALKSGIIAKLVSTSGKNPSTASDWDWYFAAALAVRDRITHRSLDSDRDSQRRGLKRVYYLSVEFLIGRMLSDFLTNLGLTDVFNAALGDLGVDLNRLRNAEPDAALGNGGLGRLAACFMDSMASLGIPARGYGIRYENGLFRQVIKDGMQQEYPEDWLSFGNPWEFTRPDIKYDISFGGYAEALTEGDSRRRVWHPAETIQAVAYDTPIVGWRGRHVNRLRLWSAHAVDPLRLDVFNSGDHVAALHDQVRSEALSKVLYPSDDSPAGRELRLRQEYFFVSASLQDLIARHLRVFGDIRSLADKTAIQLNDTHPAVAVAEMMRILIDRYGIVWEEAWEITRATFSYTNHTLLPEALESWPLQLFAALLPRHMQIIYQINAEHLNHIPQDVEDRDDVLRAVSLIDERGNRHVRMGHLAFVGSHRVNGVSALHTTLLKETLFKPLETLYPGRIVNKTNGITFRRWLLECNPRLTNVLRSVCGDGMLDDPMQIRELARHADDAGLQEALARAKRANKIALSRLIRERVNVRVDPDALFDVQIKRIHEYKRQLLNLLETIAHYEAIKAHPTYNWAPRVKIFAGKAAASYAHAKLIIRLANDIAKVVNNDPQVRGVLKVVFLPNYNVSLAEVIIPAADLSEQISTAGMEASGTGNMKLSLNGALTIGTLDGANVEIRDHVGAENIFIFGLKTDEVEARRKRGLDATRTIAASESLSNVLDAIESGYFSPEEPDRYSSLVETLRYSDYFLCTADFDDYCKTQQRIGGLWHSSSEWLRISALNIAHMSWFTSDRAIAEYAADIWKVEPKFPPIGTFTMPTSRV
ncbi:MAG TPA: glycogen/starch/alpha-glucan phosphorylase [Xanthobacteraceae bacterium]|nr:glycogen/starch/alpha-glucan phosphorylase [Xanthobacteraceae bacterium]